MAQITIGVPVYNASALLEESLLCVERQSFKDFIVLIYDNASTDETCAIAQKFIERDARFKLIKRDHNAGIVQNFVDPMFAAKNDFNTPYFLWRAFDDLSDDDYIERLFNALENAPHADLTVSTIQTGKLNKNVQRISSAPKKYSDDQAAQIMHLLNTVQAAWIYGLFRIEPLIQAMEDVPKRYPFLWAQDHGVLLHFILNNSVIGVKDTHFYQRKTRLSEKVDPPGSLSERWAMNKAFTAYCLTLLKEAHLDATVQKVIKPMLIRHAHQCTNRTRILQSMARNPLDALKIVLNRSDK